MTAGYYAAVCRYLMAPQQRSDPVTTVTLTEQDLFLIAEARRLAPALKASISDRDRHAGWLLADLADLAGRLGDATAGTGTTSIVYHSHGPDDPCLPSCPGYRGHLRLDPDTAAGHG